MKTRMRKKMKILLVKIVVMVVEKVLVPVNGLTRNGSPMSTSYPVRYLYVIM